MALTENELNDVLSRAANLLSPEGQRKINNASRNVTFDENGDYNISNRGYVNENRQYSQPVRQNYNNQASKLPKVIQESILNNPLDDVGNEYSVSGSILDSFDISPKPKPQAQQMYENASYEQYGSSQPIYGQPVQQYSQQPMLSIDYNYIRTIVNECVQANLKQIKEELLKESSLKMIRLGGENKIQLVDNKNNLYESKLEFKKNLSKK